MINDFLTVILGSEFSSSSEKKQSHDLMIKHIFQTKKDNNVWFNMSKRPSSDIQCKSIVSRQSASNSNDIVKMSDDKNYLSNINPGKPFWSTSNEISKKNTTLSVFNVRPSLRNNSFANELLKK